MTKETIAQKARRLRLDRRSYGDHGFRGRALDAWHEQRAYCRRALKVIENARYGRVARSQRAGFFPDCPRSVGRGGTASGESWAGEAMRFIAERTDYSR